MTIHLSTALIFFLHDSHFHHRSNVISQWVTGTAVQTPSVMYCGAAIRKLESPRCGKNLHSNHSVWNWFYLSGIWTISSGFPLPIKCSFYNLEVQGMLMARDEGPNYVFLLTPPQKAAIPITRGTSKRVLRHFSTKAHEQVLMAHQVCQFLVIITLSRLGVSQTSAGSRGRWWIDNKKGTLFNRGVKVLLIPVQFN